MRILVVSNLYPPHYIGGYEIGCKDVTESLIRKGHKIRVLTSTYGAPSPENTDPVFRELHHSFSEAGESVTSRSKKLKRPVNQYLNQRILNKHVRDFEPDLLFFWNLSHIGTWPLRHSTGFGLPSVMYVSDQWIALAADRTSYREKPPYFHTPARFINHLFQRIANQLLGLTDDWPLPQSVPMYFTSGFISDTFRANGIPMTEGSEVIHWGVDAVWTGDEICRSTSGDIFTVCYVGQIIAYKGIECAIRAFGELMHRQPGRKFRFEIAGRGPEGFVESMKRLVFSLGISDSVNFVGRLDRGGVVSLLARSDVYVFPSEWDEPFSIALLEGMSAGCAVVATTTGGSGEIVVHEVNSLCYSARNVAGLADSLERLLLDPDLRIRLGGAASSLIREKYKLSKMVDRIEAKLEEQLASSSLVSCKKKNGG